MLNLQIIELDCSNLTDTRDIPRQVSTYLRSLSTLDYKVTVLRTAVESC